MQKNLFIWLTVARLAQGYAIGGEYPTSSASASEAANDKLGKKHRSQVFILVTNLVLVFGTIVSLSVFLIGIIWRTVFGFGAFFPHS